MFLVFFRLVSGYRERDATNGIRSASSSLLFFALDIDLDIDKIDISTSPHKCPRPRKSSNLNHPLHSWSIRSSTPPAWLAPYN